MLLPWNHLKVYFKRWVIYWFAVNSCVQRVKPGTNRVDSQVRDTLVIVHGLSRGVRENLPGINDEGESLIRKWELILLRVQKQREFPILTGNEVCVERLLRRNLQHGVPVRKIIDPFISSEECVGDGDYLVGVQ